jgi:hypothetical protein
MKPIGSLALCLALASGTAQAQTTVTRQVTSEPVETVITQDPGGTAITRRILSPEPGVTYAAPPPAYVPAPASAVETETYVAPAPIVTTRRVTTTRRATTARPGRATTASPARSRTATTRTAPAGRTVVRTTTVQPALDQAVVLTPAQRQVIYRTIAQREVYRAPVAVPMAPPVVAETEVVEPDYPLRSIYPAGDSYYGYRDAWPWDSQPVVRVAPVAATYVVGSRLPQSVPLVAVPDVLAGRIPNIASYSYASVGDRVYLVDPATGVIVADVTQ